MIGISPLTVVLLVGSIALAVAGAADLVVALLVGAAAILELALVWSAMQDGP